MFSSAPRYASLIVPEKPTSLLGGYTGACFSGLSPLNPPPFKELMRSDSELERERSQGFKGGDFSQKNTTRPLTEWSVTLPRKRW